MEIKLGAEIHAICVVGVLKKRVEIEVLETALLEIKAEVECGLLNVIRLYSGWERVNIHQAQDYQTEARYCL
jgi:hypothetical protein